MSVSACSDTLLMSSKPSLPCAACYKLLLKIIRCFSVCIRSLKSVQSGVSDNCCSEEDIMLRACACVLLMRSKPRALVLGLWRYEFGRAVFCGRMCRSVMLVSLFFYVV